MAEVERSPQPDKPMRLVGDLGVAAALFVALVIVYVIDHSQGSPPAIAAKQRLPLSTPAASSEVPTEELRLGVTPEIAEFDDMGQLLDELGEGYRHENFPLDDLRDLEKTAKYQVIFFCCSGVPENWLGRPTGLRVRGGSLYAPNPKVLAQVKASLRAFVGRGGTLYVSDLHYPTIAAAFPEFAEQDEQQSGTAQVVNASVLDPGLKELIGPQVELRFDQRDWRPALFRGEGVTTYIEATYRSTDQTQQKAPMLVRFPFGEGTVIFTSFHNEKQNNEVEMKLLRYLVFSAVTAKVDTDVKRMMVQGGFSPAKKSLFSASPGESSFTGTYSCAEAGPLQFVLGFQNRGARLRLTVTDPSGKSQEREAADTIVIDVPDAQPGQWTYRVTALALPNENFPFTVTVGRK